MKISEHIESKWSIRQLSWQNFRNEWSFLPTYSQYQTKSAKFGFNWIWFEDSPHQSSGKFYRVRFHFFWQNFNPRFKGFVQKSIIICRNLFRWFGTKSYFFIQKLYLSRLVSRHKDGGGIRADRRWIWNSYLDSMALSTFLSPKSDLAKMQLHMYYSRISNKRATRLFVLETDCPSSRSYKSRYSLYFRSYSF